MSSRTCEREDQISAAIRSGKVDAELTTHAEHCPICSDIVLLSGFLREQTDLALTKRAALPNAAGIWRKAQMRAKQKAVSLALRPIRVMTAVACVVAACSPWLRAAFPLGQQLAAEWSRMLDLTPASTSVVWPATLSNPAILLGFFGTILLLGLSSWYILRQE